MTLRKKDEDVQPEFDPAEVMRMEKFTEWIKELAIYLGKFYGKDYTYSQGIREKSITTVPDYDKYILVINFDHKDHTITGVSSNLTYAVCLASYYGKSKNIYIRVIVETIFCDREHRDGDWPHKCRLLPYGCNYYDFDNEHYVNKIKKDFQEKWRDDIHYPTLHSKDWFLEILKKIKTSYYKYDKWENMKEYNLFWNLFLLAMDDDIYNKQLSNVIELAHYLDFDEPMLRDWCRAVEYVMNGNKLSQDCDLECETVEGARFFLHKEE